MSTSTTYGGPASWSASTLNPDSRRITPGPQAFDELRSAVLALQGSDIPLSRIGRQRADLPGWDVLLESLSSALHDGAGFAVLSLPSSWSDEEIRLGLWILGLEIGKPMAQNPRGELIVSVRDEGSDRPTELVRGYSLPVELDFHVDYCDVLAMACLQPAKRGGENHLASATRIHDILAKEDPEALRVLYEPFPIDRQDEEPEGELPFFMCPVFASQDGQLSMRYAPRQIRNSARLADAPPLSGEQVRALQAVKDITSREGLSISVRLERAEVLFLTNHLVLHSRSAFESHPEPERRRHLLRLWLNDDVRALSPDFAAVARNGNVAWNKVVSKETA